jgi:hypothetical protein
VIEPLERLNGSVSACLAEPWVWRLISHRPCRPHRPSGVSRMKTLCRSNRRDATTSQLNAKPLPMCRGSHP